MKRGIWKITLIAATETKHEYERRASTNSSIVITFIQWSSEWKNGRKKENALTLFLRDRSEIFNIRSYLNGMSNAICFSSFFIFQCRVIIHFCHRLFINTFWLHAANKNRLIIMNAKLERVKRSLDFFDWINIKINKKWTKNKQLFNAQHSPCLPFHSMDWKWFF